MNEYESRYRHVRLADENVRSIVPIVVGLLLTLGLTSAILAWGEVSTGLFFAGALILIGACVAPEWALLIITILAPLATITEKYAPTLLPGTGLTPMNIVVFALLIGAWLQRYSTSEPAREATSFDKALLLYIGWSFVSVLISIYSIGANSKYIGEWLAMVTGYMMYWIVRRRWRSVKLAKFSVLAVLAMVVTEAIIVTNQYRQQDAVHFDWKLKYNIVGTFTSGNSNDIGMYLSVYGLVALGLFLSQRKSPFRWLYLAVFGMASAATFFTYSRGAYWALILGMVAVTLYKHKRYVVPVLIFLILLPSILPYSIWGRFNTSGDSSAETRKDIWRYAVGVAMTHPLGLGWRGYEQMEADRHQTLRDPHNQYILVAVDQGWPGEILFLGMLAAAGREILRAVRRARTPFVQGLGVGMFGALIAFMVNDAFGSRMLWFHNVQHFFFLMGILIVLTGRKPGEEPEPELEPEPALAKTPSPWRYKSYV